MYSDAPFTEIVPMGKGQLSEFLGSYTQQTKNWVWRGKGTVARFNEATVSTE